MKTRCDSNETSPHSACGRLVGDAACSLCFRRRRLRKRARKTATTGHPYSTAATRVATLAGRVCVDGCPGAASTQPWFLRMRMRVALQRRRPRLGDLSATTGGAEHEPSQRDHTGPDQSAAAERRGTRRHTKPTRLPIQRAPRCRVSGAVPAARTCARRARRLTGKTVRDGVGKSMSARHLPPARPACRGPCGSECTRTSAHALAAQSRLLRCQSLPIRCQRHP